jgi:hypothetical protein
MIGLEDRQALAQDIEVAHAAGARLRPACEVAGIDLRTLQRWKLQQAPDGALAADAQPCPEPLGAPGDPGRGQRAALR